MSTFPRNPKAAPAVPAQPRYGRMDIGLDQVSAGIKRATDWLLGQQHPEGYWCGELEADSMLESDYIFVHTLLGTGDRGKMERAVNEILRHQNGDGHAPGGRVFLVRLRHHLHRHGGGRNGQHDPITTPPITSPWT